MTILVIEREERTTTGRGSSSVQEKGIGSGRQTTTRGSSSGQRSGGVPQPDDERTDRHRGSDTGTNLVSRGER